MAGKCNPAMQRMLIKNHDKAHSFTPCSQWSTKLAELYKIMDRRAVCWQRQQCCMIGQLGHDSSHQSLQCSRHAWPELGEPHQEHCKNAFALYGKHLAGSTGCDRAFEDGRSPSSMSGQCANVLQALRIRQGRQTLRI